MSAFFVKGAASSKDPAAYCATVQHVPEWEREKFIHGERLHKDTEKAKRFMTEALPITDITEKYVIFTPLSKIPPGEKPVVVVFLADPLQVTGLVTLVGAVREGTDPVRVPPMAACQQIGAFVYDEAKKEHPRAVLGYTDLAARANVGKTIPEQMFTFAVPFRSTMRWRRRQRTAYSTARSGKGLRRNEKEHPHDEHGFPRDRIETCISVPSLHTAPCRVRGGGPAGGIPPMAGINRCFAVSLYRMAAGR